MYSVRQFPHPALRSYVHCYWEVRYELPPGATHHLPFGCTGRTHWIIILGDPFQTTIDAGGSFSNYDSMFVGQMIRPFTHHVTNTVHLLVVDFTPTGFYQLWSVPAQELVEQTVATEHIRGAATHSITDQLRKASSSADRLALLDKFLVRRLMYTTSTDSRIEAAVDLLQQQPGPIQIRQLAQWLNYPERTLNRRFTQTVGLSPKTYARVQRFLKTRYWLTHKPSHQWNDWLTLAGYFDQAHLINEFRYFTGKPPLLYTLDNQSTLDFLRES